MVYFYFSFTSLSTVGLGDYNPRSNSERLFIACGLLVGVAIFSYIMGEFCKMVESFSTYNQLWGGEGDELSKFFGVLKRFNHNEDFNLEIKRQIERYFDYRWDKDKFQVLHPSKQENFIEQCPDSVQNDFHTDYLFQEFLSCYRTSFDLTKTRYGKYKYSRYTFEDSNYRTFMFAIFCSLEPIRFEANQILFDELDEFSYIAYILNNSYQIGFSINKEHYFKIKLKH